MIAITTTLVVTATVYGYAPAAGGPNVWGDGSVTRWGLEPGPSIAACGEHWPLGAMLETAGRRVVCGDTGGGIRGYDVDLWFPTEAAALQHGRPELPVIYRGQMGAPMTTPRRQRYEPI